jgi:hypothetical protein
MARSYGETALQQQNQAQKDEFAFRRGIKERYRKELEGLVSGEPYDRAKSALQDETRRQAGELLAASNTRNIGALGGASDQMARRAAYKMADMELDKTEGRLRGLEGLQEMDTTQSETNKKKGEYGVAIRDFARKSGKLGMGLFGEQEETAKFVEELAEAETNEELAMWLRERALALRGGGKLAGGKKVEKWDV